MTKETARFLLDLVNRQTLTISAPDFDQVVAQVQAARVELATILSETDS